MAMVVTCEAAETLGLVETIQDTYQQCKFQDSEWCVLQMAVGLVDTMATQVSGLRKQLARTLQTAVVVTCEAARPWGLIGTVRHISAERVLGLRK